MMKYATTILAVMGLSLASVSAQTSIALVNLQEVFKEYYKTKEADARLKEILAGFKKEYQDMMGDYQKMVEEAGKIRDEGNDPTLSKEVREEKQKALQTKVQDLKNFERKLREFDVTRRKQLDDQSSRMRKTIVEDITKVIENIGKTKNYNLILDNSGLTMNGTATVLYSSNLPNLTPDIIKTMNATAPAGSAPAAAPAAK